MAATPTQLILRGGPQHGVQMTRPVDLEGSLDDLTLAGYTYRDSGRWHKARRIFDWLPATGFVHRR